MKTIIESIFVSVVVVVVVDCECFNFCRMLDHFVHLDSTVTLGGQYDTRACIINEWATQPIVLNFVAVNDSQNPYATKEA